MFNNRKTDAGNGTPFEPDPAMPLIATLSGTPADRHQGTRTMLERLIGRERQPDGSARLVVLPYGGAPRKLGPDEPYRILTKAEARADGLDGFDLAGWQLEQRQQLRDLERARARARALKDSRESLLRHLALLKSTAEDIAAELVADGWARRLLPDGGLVLATPAEVELSAWPYLERQGLAQFTPASTGRRLLAHRTPTRRDRAEASSGRFHVVGHLEQDGQTWTAYLAQVTWLGLGSWSVELVGPGVAGIWAEDEGHNPGEWVSARLAEDEAAAAAARQAALLPVLRERLLTEYAVTPRTPDEEAACEALKREGLAYEIEGTLVLR